MKLLQASLLASALAIAAAAGAPSPAHAVDALDLVNKTLAQAPDLSALPHQRVQLKRPPFVHDHDQVAKGGPKVVQFTLPIVEQEVTIDGDKIRLKLADKRAALVDIGRHLGIFEKDNKQKADPLTALIESLSGNVLGVAKNSNDEGE